MNRSGVPSGIRPGVTYSCLYRTHGECGGVRMEGGQVVGECACECHKSPTGRRV